MNTIPIDVLLFIIREELRNRKFFNTLLHVGIEDSWYRSDFSPLIMHGAGLEINFEEDFKHYDLVMDKYSEVIEPGNKSLEEVAEVVLRELTRSSSGFYN
jgi:hypothetical protein